MFYVKRIELCMISLLIMEIRLSFQLYRLYGYIRKLEIYFLCIVYCIIFINYIMHKKGGVSFD